MSKSRFAIVSGVLQFLAVCILVMVVASTYQSRSTTKAPSWLTQEEFYQYIEGHPITLPGGESLTLGRGQVESLRIESRGDDPGPEGAEVSFAVKTNQGRYTVRGLMSLHMMDTDRYPIVNLGQGWSVNKQ